ncbi:MAG TPA: hypothetical protein VK287_00395 [Gaiellaceae bacterium]|nr:hypothetical protein [Gaiellaceae bacterium]
MSLVGVDPVTTQEHEAAVEELEDRIAALVAERQQLRAVGAGRQWLEQNRLLLGQSQRQLGYALIARHLPALSA